MAAYGASVPSEQPPLPGEDHFPDGPKALPAPVQKSQPVLAR